MTVYLFHVVEEKTQKSLFFSKFAFIRAGRKLKTKAKTNLQTRTHKSHGRTVVAGNRLQENLVKSVSCRFCHADVPTLLPCYPATRVSSDLPRQIDLSRKIEGDSARRVAPGLVHLGSCPVKTSIQPLEEFERKSPTNLVAGERPNSDLAKEIFRQEQHLSPLSTGH